MIRKAIIFGINGTKLTTEERYLLKTEKPWGIILFSRNIKNICVVPVQSASTYDLLDCQMILANEASIEVLNKQLS